MHTSRTMGCAVALAMGAALACSHQSASAPPIGVTPPPVSAAPAQPQASGTPERGARRAATERIDPAAALLQAADRASLTESQRNTMSSLEGDLRASARGLGQTFRAVQADLAAQVREGTIDPARVQASESAMTHALHGHLTQEADALNTLHAALTPEQRRALVGAVRSEEPGRAERQGEPEASPDRAGHLDRLTSALGLDSDQQRRVAAMLAQEEPGSGTPDGSGQGRWFEQVVGAFGNHQFDAHSILEATEPSPAAIVHGIVQRDTAFLSQLLPILRPDQRQKLASRMEGLD